MNFLNLKPLEIILILVVVLLLFGAKRLPEMAKGIGQSVREFRKGIKDMKDDIANESKLEEPKKETEKAG
jgi:sec-independent protein translocase protein TatA